MDDALRYLEHAPRTIRETERKLDSLNYGEAEVLLVVNRLLELRLLDDRAYCQNFVESRLRAKPVSKRHLAEQLRAHEADPAEIQLALEDIPDDSELENAITVARKHMAQMQNLEPAVRRQRLNQRMAARGFSYDTIRTALNRIEEEGDTDDPWDGD